MNDLQKKLDELTQLREQLVHLTNNFELASIKNISGTSVYVGKAQVIAQQYQSRQLETKTIFNNVTNTVQSKIKESRRLAKDSQRLAKESQRSTKESQRLANDSRRLAKDSRRLAKDSQRLANESRRLAKGSEQSIKESQQLTLTNTESFKNKNNINVDSSINSIKILISTIEKDINLVTTELTRLRILDEIQNQSLKNEYLEEFLKLYLMPGSIATDDVDVLSKILFKIKLNCDWKYPGLQVHPISKEWIDCMITADPLYITDHTDLSIYNENITSLPTQPITESIVDYSLEYQRRLRIYNIKNQDFSVLPQAVFGCISCYDFLNHFSLSDIKSYLIKFIDLLKPGGSFVCVLDFSYMLSTSTVNLVEYDYFKYSVKLITGKFIENNGYKIKSIVDLSQNDWSSTLLIEAQKPGTLTTSKAHQVLGSIIEK